MVDPSERNVRLTVNEYETLLMQHDLIEVLRDPLRFARLKAQNPAACDVVPLVDSLKDALGLDQPSVERLVAKGLSLPARHFMRSRRVSFLAGVESNGGQPRLLRGPYQSPILVQWQRAAGRQRHLQIVVYGLS